VANAKKYIEAYLGSHLGGEEFFRYKPAFNNTTKIDYINYTAYMDGEHKYMFDEENIIHILQAKGFRDVKPRAFDVRLDRKDRDFESIYADARK
jgi:hypothetical protein